MYRILILEDEAVVADYLRFILDPYHIDICTNPQDAIKKCDIQKYDLILIDLVMGPLDGFYFLEQITQATPIIVISSLHDKQSLLRAYQYGIIDYIVKPFDADITLLKIQNILGDNRSNKVLFREDFSVDFYGQIINFTRIEFELFKLLYDNRRIYSKENLIDIIWFSNYNMSPKIVEVTISKIRKKLLPTNARIINVKFLGYRYEQD